MNIVKPKGITSNTLSNNFEFEFSLKVTFMRFYGSTFAFNCKYSKFSKNVSGFANFNLYLPFSEIICAYIASESFEGLISIDFVVGYTWLTN